MLKKAETNGPYDAIIGQWSRTMKGRVYWSYLLYKKGIAKNIIYSGSAVYSPFVEAKIMALYAVAIGIPAEHVYTEPTAEHSSENLYYSYHLGKKLGYQKMALATDPFQSKLLKKFSKRMQLDVPMIPMVFDSLESITKIDPVIDDQQAYRADFISILEREGFWERLKGTRGKKIKLVTND
jgi:uncharacterized SAM-binding protein YcdF (DUF218 family)